MNQQSMQRGVSRRKMLTGLGATGLVSAQAVTFGHDAAQAAQQDGARAEIVTCPSVAALRAESAFREARWVATAGFFSPGDGGGALYQIVAVSDETQPNGADVIALDDRRAAVLVEREQVNYRMFGAVGDGDNDDGVQIKRAHEYANRYKVPVVNTGGEYWIKQTNNIPIQTNVDWGQTIFHIDERFNSRRYARFVVLNDEPSQQLDLDDQTKAALLRQIRPGVQIIPELADYAGCLIRVVDEDDRIGIRAGERYHKRGWAREELFYVEEEGRIIGDIAWEFKNFTTVTAIPCNKSYLVIEGGGFHFSGHTPQDSTGYHQLGIQINRSRTIVRQQWMGLEEGHSDDSLEPRSGLYVLREVYDVTLQDIRAMPWEKNRCDKDREVKHGTYGIGGARMLNCTFRNLTAEAGWVAWGVFGTNLNKNFRVENCRLNRIDVHFHCWNLYISNSAIGFKGITVTGGGDLFIDNTTRDGNQFVSFRRDYGAKWDGRIRLRGCTLRPTSNSSAAVLSYHPSDFDYQYPIGFARTVTIDDLLVDYRAAPQSSSPCWLMDVVPFSKTSAGERLFFPQRLLFRDIRVEGRQQGVRLLRLPSPGNYDLRREGHYDGSRLEPNCTLTCQRVQLESLTPAQPGDPEQVHLLMGGDSGVEYADDRALLAEIRFADCEHVCVFLGHCRASARFERCGVNVVHAPQLEGELAFSDCHLQPRVRQGGGPFYRVNSALGTRFTNCTLHAPVVEGTAAPQAVDEMGFLTINRTLEHYHLNTALANSLLRYLREQGIELSPEFVARLRSHSPL